MRTIPLFTTWRWKNCQFINLVLPLLIMTNAECGVQWRSLRFYSAGRAKCSVGSSIPRLMHERQEWCDQLLAHQLAKLRYRKFHRTVSEAPANAFSIVFRNTSIVLPLCPSKEPVNTNGVMVVSCHTIRLYHIFRAYRLLVIVICWLLPSADQTIRYHTADKGLHDTVPAMPEELWRPTLSWAANTWLSAFKAC